MKNRPSIEKRGPSYSPLARVLNPADQFARLICLASQCLLVLLLAATTGCGSASAQKRDREFFTSGSREADQRAAQRMAKAEQISDTGKGASDKDGESSGSSGSGASPQSAQAEGRRTLFERLGREPGIDRIVDDFVTRVLADPRVNWERRGIERGGLFRRDRSVTWEPTAEHVSQLKKHLAQFIALATGGPARYEGKDMRASHHDLRITNPEFDAAVGDLKATLDKLQIPDQEQKELLAIIESTRPQIVTVR